MWGRMCKGGTTSVPSKQSGFAIRLSPLSTRLPQSARSSVSLYRFLASRLPSGAPGFARDGAGDIPALMAAPREVMCRFVAFLYWW